MDSWLDLVRQYGDARCLVGIGRDYAANTEEAQALFARIAALVPQQPVQARDGHTLWWQHYCGHVMGVHETRPPGEDECPACLPDDRHGPWLPLLVAAPDGDRTPERRGQTPSKGEIHVVAVLDESGNPRLVVQWPPDSADPRDTYQQKLIDERDEACAEVERLRTKVNDVRADRDRIVALGEHLRDQLRAETERLKAQLNASIGRCNCAVCHEVPAAQSDPLVLRLPEVPEGTVALVGVESGRRWTRYTGPLADRSARQWECSSMIRDDQSIFAEEPEGVRVELAPPREQRTAAEIWRDIRQPSVVLSVPIELAEALDREAGL